MVERRWKDYIIVEGLANEKMKVGDMRGKNLVSDESTATSFSTIMPYHLCACAHLDTGIGVCERVHEQRPNY